MRRNLLYLSPKPRISYEQRQLDSLARIEQRTIKLRRQRMLIDADLTELYGVPTRMLNQTVRRNIERFPEDFMFTLNSAEKPQGITACDHLAKLKFSKALPLAYTEHGPVMASAAL